MELSTPSSLPLPAAAEASADAVQDAAWRGKAEAAAEKFEGIFIAEMLRQMRRSTREMAGEDSVFNDRINEDMLDLADGVLADALAGQRAFGIADAILRQVLPALKPAAERVALSGHEPPNAAETAGGNQP